MSPGAAVADPLALESDVPEKMPQPKGRGKGPKIAVEEEADEDEAEVPRVSGFFMADGLLGLGCFLASSFFFSFSEGFGGSFTSSSFRICLPATGIIVAFPWSS